MTPESVASLRQAATAATPGPWRAAIDPHPAAIAAQKEAASVYSAETLIYSSRRDYGCLPETWEQQRSDAAFIAACSPDVVLSLLSAVEERDALREVIAWALGERDAFPDRPDSAPATLRYADGRRHYPFYWWRSELRRRAEAASLTPTESRHER